MLYIQLILFTVLLLIYVPLYALNGGDMMSGLSNGHNLIAQDSHLRLHIQRYISRYMYIVLFYHVSYECFTFYAMYYVQIQVKHDLNKDVLLLLIVLYLSRPRRLRHVESLCIS